MRQAISAVLTARAAVVAMSVAMGSAVAAHHSFPAYYFEERSVSIEGEVVEFVNAAPHAWLYLRAPDDRGTMRRFGAEWANPTRLARDGITSETFKPGDRVIVTGSPGRNAAEYKIHLKAIERPADGWKWRQAARRR
jgi:hypothetical protein